MFTPYLFQAGFALIREFGGVGLETLIHLGAIATLHLRAELLDVVRTGPVASLVALLGEGLLSRHCYSKRERESNYNKQAFLTVHCSSCSMVLITLSGWGEGPRTRLPVR